MDVVVKLYETKLLRSHLSNEILSSSYEGLRKQTTTPKRRPWSQRERNYTRYIWNAICLWLYCTAVLVVHLGHGVVHRASSRSVMSRILFLWVIVGAPAPKSRSKIGLPNLYMCRRNGVSTYYSRDPTEGCPGETQHATKGWRLTG